MGSRPSFKPPIQTSLPEFLDGAALKIRLQVETSGDFVRPNHSGIPISKNGFVPGPARGVTLEISIFGNPSSLLWGRLDKMKLVKSPPPNPCLKVRGILLDDLGLDHFG